MLYILRAEEDGTSVLGRRLVIDIVPMLGRRTDH